MYSQSSFPLPVLFPVILFHQTPPRTSSKVSWVCPPPQVSSQAVKPRKLSHGHACLLCCSPPLSPSTLRRKLISTACVDLFLSAQTDWWNESTVFCPELLDTPRHEAATIFLTKCRDRKKHENWKNTEFEWHTATNHLTQSLSHQSCWQDNSKTSRLWWRRPKCLACFSRVALAWVRVVLDKRLSGSSVSSSILSSGTASSGTACICTPGAWGSILRFSKSRCLKRHTDSKASFDFRV